MSDPLWQIRHYLLDAAQARAAEDLLDAGSHSCFSLSSRADGRFDLELYLDSSRNGDPTAALAGLGLQPSLASTQTESVLLAGLLNEDPVELAQGLWIDPCGRLTENHPGVVLRLPPGRAWGDGRHPTTRMLARWLVDDPPRAQRVLDLGCGTGVLGLAASLLGAALVDAADLDPDAVAATRQALSAHGLQGCQVWQGDLLAAVPEQRSYDLLIGNLYADLVLELLADPRLPLLLPRGQLWLSGIAQARGKAVATALEVAGWRITRQSSEAWWLALQATRAARH